MTHTMYNVITDTVWHPLYISVYLLHMTSHMVYKQITHYRTTTGSYFESLVSSRICTIRSKWVLFTIDQTFPLMVGWNYSVWHAHKLVSIYLLKQNGNWRTSK